MGESNLPSTDLQRATRPNARRYGWPEFRNMVSRRVKLAARGARRPRMRWGVYEYLPMGGAPALYTFSGLYRELASPDSGTGKNALEIELRLVHELPVY